MEISPEYSHRTEPRRNAAASNFDQTVMDLVWLLFDTSLITSGFNRGEPNQFAFFIRCIFKLGSGINDDDEKLGDDRRDRVAVSSVGGRRSYPKGRDRTVYGEPMLCFANARSRMWSPVDEVAQH